MDGHITAHEGALDIYEEFAEGEAAARASRGCSSVAPLSDPADRTATSAQREALESSALGLVEGVETTLDDAYTGWTTVSSSVQSTSDVLIEQVCRQVPAAGRSDSTHSSTITARDRSASRTPSPPRSPPCRRPSWPPMRRRARRQRSESGPTPTRPIASTPSPATPCSSSSAVPPASSRRRRRQ